MRFRPVDRRLEGGSAALRFFLLALLPLVFGGGSAESLPGAGREESPPERLAATSPDPPLWILFSPEAWEGEGLWDSLSRFPVRIRTRSEWLRAVSVDAGPEALAGLRGLPGVLGVRPVARLAPAGLSLPGKAASEGEGATPGPSGRAPAGPKHRAPARAQVVDSIYGALGEALEAVGIPQAHELGFTGPGVRIGILDGTFNGGHSVLRGKPPLAVRDFVDLDESVAPDPGDPMEAASHGTGLWSLISADLRGTLLGAAPDADVLLARIRGLGALTSADEDRWVAGLEWLASQGARIVLSGVSFRTFPDGGHTLQDLDGDFAPATRAADQAAAMGVLVVTPVGNQGPGAGSLEAPADGDSILSAGAIDNQGIPAAFSASGPTADGREKPELSAPGVALSLASAPGDQVVAPMSGTEFAAGILAGGAALLVEAYPDQGPMEILDFLRSSAPPGPESLMRVPNVASAIVFPQGILPLPLEEVDGTGTVTNLAPLFRWNAPTIHPVGLPVVFHLELSRDSLFRAVDVADSVVGTFARRITSPLPPRERFFWRIRARSPQGVERSEGPSSPILVPSWATLQTFNEPGGSEVPEVRPLFRWTAPELLPPAGPLTFELQILLDREGEVVQSFPGLTEAEFRVPSPLPFNVPLRWRVIAQSQAGAADTVTSAGPLVVTSGENPPATLLYQNFPNPFPDPEFGQGETRVWFDLARESNVVLAVHDLRGRLVRQLIPRDGCAPVVLPAGVYGREGGGGEDPCVALSWDGTDDRSREVPSGVYLLRLRADGVVAVRRMVLWR